MAVEASRRSQMVLASACGAVTSRARAFDERLLRLQGLELPRGLVQERDRPRDVGHPSEQRVEVLPRVLRRSREPRHRGIGIVAGEDSR